MIAHLLALLAVVCPSKAVGASEFNDSNGYRGDNLYRSGPSYAELGMGTALGDLPYGKRLTISYRGRKVSARKLDVGLGGGDVFGLRRAIDLHAVTARRLGFSGLGVVRVQEATC